MVVIVIVIGVSGSGKTELGSRAASQLGWSFLDADTLHPPANKEKMKSGSALTDVERGPWLRKLKDELQSRAKSENIVVAFSGLKRAHRDFIRTARDDINYIHLKASFDTIRTRLEERTHEYMPASLLESQFDTFEVPATDEKILTVSVEGEFDQSLDLLLSTVKTIF